MKKNLNEQIASVLEARRLVNLSLAETIKVVQSVCDHEIVAEAPYQCGGFNPRRICLHCRTEEEGSHWSGGKTWSAREFGKAILGNSEDRIVTTVDRDELYKLRLPRS